MQIFSRLLIALILLNPLIQSASKDPVRGKNGMVVSASEIATDVGIEILKSGGNAIDAAVAVGFALAVTHPTGGNLGGGGFMVIRFNDGYCTTIDFREKAPNAANKNIYLDQNGNYIKELSREGWTSSGVPGSVAGLLFALDKFGNFDREKVIRHAQKLAEEGFRLNYRMAQSLNYNKNDFSRYESTKKIFVKKSGQWEEGDLLVQKDLSETLNMIINSGAEAFYSGSIAKLISEQAQKNGWQLTEKDLFDYKPVEREPVKGSYRSYEVISMGPPSSGGTAIIEALNILENFKIENNDWGSSEYLHNLTETLKYVYADRAEHLGDIDYYDVPMEKLLSKDYAAEVFSKIDETAKRADEISHGVFTYNESSETTHYSIIDKDGNAVSTTVTLNSSYGNKIVVDGAGFLMNNEMDDFSAKPGVPNQFGLIGSEANSIQPGKRMLSSMTPTILVKDNQPFLIIGSPGGSTIITVVLQVILNVVEFNMNISDAIYAPRIHHQWRPDRLDFEPFAIVKDAAETLIEKGHILGNGNSSLGRAEGIIFDSTNRIYYGETDPRGYGKAAGY